MKLVILGATGGCGAELVKQAKARGHEVTAVVRSKSYRAPEGVRVVAGEITVELLREAIRDQEAVLSALGLRMNSIAPWAKPEMPNFLSLVTPRIVAAMLVEKVKRVVAISAGGVGDSYARMPGVFKAFLKVSALRYPYAELEVMESTLFDAPLDVCVVRPTGLTDGPITGKVKIAERIEGRPTISRADVAAYMLDEVVKPTFEHKTPLITVTGAA
ncbi:MAG: NAD(P)H-binding protein [Polyangiaceae bacterium]